MTYVSPSLGPRNPNKLLLKRCNAWIFDQSHAVHRVMNSTVESSMIITKAGIQMLWHPSVPCYVKLLFFWFQKCSVTNYISK